MGGTFPVVETPQDSRRFVGGETVTNKKDPAIMPGDGARAIDAIRDDFIRNAQEFQHSKDWTGETLSYEALMILAFMRGGKPNVPFHMAYDEVLKLVEERRGIK